MHNQVHVADRSIQKIAFQNLTRARSIPRLRTQTAAGYVRCHGVVRHLPPWIIGRRRFALDWPLCSSPRQRAATVRHRRRLLARTPRGPLTASGTKQHSFPDRSGLRTEASVLAAGIQTQSASRRHPVGRGALQADPRFGLTNTELERDAVLCSVAHRLRSRALSRMLDPNDRTTATLTIAYTLSRTLFGRSSRKREREVREVLTRVVSRGKELVADDAKRLPRRR